MTARQPCPVLQLNSWNRTHRGVRAAVFLFAIPFFPSPASPTPSLPIPLPLGHSPPIQPPSRATPRYSTSPLSPDILVRSRKIPQSRLRERRKFDIFRLRVVIEIAPEKFPIGFPRIGETRSHDSENRSYLRPRVYPVREIPPGLDDGLIRSLSMQLVEATASRFNSSASARFHSARLVRSP